MPSVLDVPGSSGVAGLQITQPLGMAARITSGSSFPIGSEGASKASLTDVVTAVRRIFVVDNITESQ